MLFFHTIFTLIWVFTDGQNISESEESGKNSLVKMCLSGYIPSGHSRSDPIISQSCVSDHVHTFYGPQNFHPNTSYEDIRDTPARFSTTPFVENQSLYWHPTIYEVINDDGTKVYIRSKFTITPYYRWDNSASPRTEEFPPGFRMIAHSNDPGAQKGEEEGEGLVTQCCFRGEEEVTCEFWYGLHFPTTACDDLEILFAMPTCWDGKSIGDDNDHKSHMRYTTSGKINGPCPNGFGRRLPQITITLWTTEGYNGGTYQLSDGSDVFHVDFFNGWEEGKLQEIIDDCEPTGGAEDGFHPPCACKKLLTCNGDASGTVCDADARRLVVDEATDEIVGGLPRGSCRGSDPVPKSWTELDDGLFGCEREGSSQCGADDDGPGPSPTGAPEPTSSPTSSAFRRCMKTTATRHNNRKAQTLRRYNARKKKCTKIKNKEKRRKCSKDTNAWRKKLDRAAAKKKAKDEKKCVRDHGR
mmetsp:Transcript_19830/g.39516  ORF Transcript_19830/g.39516 Transcript_19830/m.39516 type:complete len:469 (+) Transcript_19830:344-1750(+)